MRPLVLALLLVSACGHSHPGDHSDVDADPGMTADGSASPDAAVIPTGMGVWQAAGGGSADAVVTQVLADTDGSVVAAGRFNQTVDFGKGWMASRGGHDFFVVKYAADGTVQWSRSLGGCSDEYVPSIALGTDHSVYLAGTAMFLAMPQCDPYFANARIPTPFPASVGSGAVILVRYDADGNETWATSWATTSPPELVDDVAIAARGDAIALALDAATPITFGATTVTPVSEDSFTTALVLLSASDGSVRWAHRIGNSGNPLEELALAMDDDEIVVSGSSQDSVDVGAAQPYVGFGNSDAYLAAYARTDGGYRWSQHLGGPGQDHATGIARAADGSYWQTGWFQQTAYFGGSALTTTMTGAGYAAHFAAGGTPIASFPTITTMESRGAGAAAFGDGVVVVGNAWPDGAHNVAVATRFDGQGNTLWTHDLATMWSDAAAVAVAPHGEIVVGGDFSSMLTVPGLPATTSSGGLDAFVVRLAP